MDSSLIGSFLLYEVNYISLDSVFGSLLRTKRLFILPVNCTHGAVKLAHDYIYWIVIVIEVTLVRVGDIGCHEI